MILMWEFLRLRRILLSVVMGESVIGNVFEEVVVVSRKSSARTSISADLLENARDDWIENCAKVGFTAMTRRPRSGHSSTWKHPQSIEYSIQYRILYCVLVFSLETSQLTDRACIDNLFRPPEGLCILEYISKFQTVKKKYCLYVLRCLDAFT